MKAIRFPPEFLKRLELLAVVSKRIFSGKLRGERRSPRRGASVEFKDYRNYTQGDDFRHVDWKAYARLEQLFLKLFVEEQDLFVYLLLDQSQSMAFGDPDKFEFACRTVAALGYIALANLDRIQVHAFSEAGLRSSPVWQNRNRIFHLLEYLQGLTCRGRTGLKASVDHFLGETPRKGLVILVSDFLTEDGYEDVLKRVKYSGYDVVALQILSPEEVDPPIGGDWRLIDSELETGVDLSLGPYAARLYKARLKAYTEALDQFCRAQDIAVARAVTDQDFQDMILKYFREVALLQ